jgi:2-dehydro-3-deoxyglucarate aldolase/4-hydroxy-2-oxoheptanedioate aldolase
MPRERRIRARVCDGESVVGYWLTLADPAAVELVASLGFDFVVLDTEHSPVSLSRVADLVRAVDAAAGDTEPVVRVPANDATVLKRVLDMHPAGVLVPMVEDGADAEAFVRATRYAPEGVRGVGASRATGYGRDILAAVERDASEILTVAQVESRAATDRADEIAAAGVDSLFVGPTDLSTSLGATGEFDAAFREAVDATLDAAAAADVPVGTLATAPADVERWREWGFDWLVAGVDVRDLAAGAEAMLSASGSAGEE